MTFSWCATTTLNFRGMGQSTSKSAQVYAVHCTYPLGRRVRDGSLNHGGSRALLYAFVMFWLTRPNIRPNPELNSVDSLGDFISFPQ